jgi:hypothetical protein
LKDETIRHEIGADDFTRSLGEAVTCCVKAAEIAAM